MKVERGAGRADREAGADFRVGLGQQIPVVGIFQGGDAAPTGATLELEVHSLSSVSRGQPQWAVILPVRIILTGLIPFGGQAKFGQLGVEKGAVHFVAGHGQHAADIRQMFFGMAFAEIFQFF